MHVYLIGSKTGAVKIGLANNVRRRLKALQVGSPVELFLMACKRFDTREAAVEAEKQFHEMFAEHRLQGEWFNISSEQIKIHMPEFGTLAEIPSYNRAQEVTEYYMRTIASWSDIAVSNVSKLHEARDREHLSQILTSKCLSGELARVALARAA